MDLQLKNKVILVAGASKGLGFAIASQLAEESARLSICSRSLDNITEAKKRLCAKTEVLAFECDVSDAQSIQCWVQSALDHFGRIDGLVVNAGGPAPGVFDDFADEAWQQAFELTLMSSVRLIRAVLPIMRQQKSGSILVLGSTSVKEPIEGLLLSNVMRSGVNSLVKSLSRSEACWGIRFNSLIPGVIATDRILQLDALQANAHARTLEQQQALRTSSIPLARYGNANELANAAAFLLSDAASYITGASLVVDGGLIRSV